MSNKTKNNIIFISLAAIILSVGTLYWSLDGSLGWGAWRSPETPDSEVTSPALEAPLKEAVTDVEEVSDQTVSLEPIALEPEPVESKSDSDKEESNQEINSELVSRYVELSVPFTSQAPRFKWSDSRQQDGCEEASVLMAMAWVKGEKGVAAAEWEKRIIDLADFEQEKYGEHRDVSVQDTVDWMFKDYFSYGEVEIVKIKNSAQIVAELEAGNLVLVPVDGQALNNPNFTPPGPEHHFIVIKGYDYEKEEFITNDPGTRLGEDYRYSEDLIFEALRSYPTGYHDHYDEIRKEAIIVSR